MTWKVTHTFTRTTTNKVWIYRISTGEKTLHGLYGRQMLATFAALTALHNDDDIYRVTVNLDDGGTFHLTKVSID